MKKYTLNPQKTLAILIGISKYTDFDDIDPAPNNVAALAEILADKNIFGLPKHQIKTIVEGNSAAIKGQLFEYTENAKSNGITTLLLYFAGHGYRRTDGQYFLAAADTKKRLINLDGSTALPYQSVKNIIKSSQITQNIVLLDACYSGSSIQGDEIGFKALALKGGYTITSSSSKEVSYFDTDEEYTLFTGELLRILQAGLPIEKDRLSLGHLYEALYGAVRKKNPKMTPQQQASEEITGSNFSFFKNTQFDKEAIKRRTIKEQLKKGKALAEVLDYDEAIRAYNIALKKARPAKVFVDEIDEIHAEMDSCEEKLHLYNDFKSKYESQFKEALAQTQKELTDKVEALKTLQQTVQQKEKETKSLLDKKEATIKELSATIKQKEKSYKTTIDKLEKVIAGLKTKPKSKALPTPQGKNNTETVKNTHSEMVFIKGGTFQMGDVMGDEEETDEQVHSVTLSDYSIGQYPVTFDEYDAYCVATDQKKPDDSGWGRGRRPIIHVSWYDVVAYCNWLSKERGYTPVYTIKGKKVSANWAANGYRLPTEAEWEYAARAGGKKVRFGNGKNVIDPEEINFNGSEKYKKPYSVVGTYRGKTVEAGSLNSPNSLGLHDMSGNVWEWCWDWYDEDYYKNSPQQNPYGADKGSHRVIRGGGWSSLARYSRVSYRGRWNPEYRINDMGFRLARSSK